MVSKTTAVQTEVAIGLSGGWSMPAWSSKIKNFLGIYKKSMKHNHFFSHLNNTLKTSLSLPA